MGERQRPSILEEFERKGAEILTIGTLLEGIETKAQLDEVVLLLAKILNSQCIGGANLQGGKISVGTTLQTLSEFMAARVKKKPFNHRGTVKNFSILITPNLQEAPIYLYGSDNDGITKIAEGMISFLTVGEMHSSGRGNIGPFYNHAVMDLSYHPFAKNTWVSLRAKVINSQETQMALDDLQIIAERSANESLKNNLRIFSGGLPSLGKR